MPAVICLEPLQQFFDAEGNPGNGYKLHTYDALTGLDLAVYTTTDGNVEHTNPIVMESDGRPPSPIFYEQGRAYNLVLTNAEDVTLDANISFEVPGDDGTSASDYFDIEFFKGGTPTAGERLYAVSLRHAVNFAANFDGSGGVDAATPPATALVCPVKVNGTTVGYATLSTLNAWSFTTVGAATVECLEDDQVDIYGPADLSTVVDVGFTLAGTVA